MPPHAMPREPVILLRFPYPKMALVLEFFPVSITFYILNTFQPDVSHIDAEVTGAQSCTTADNKYKTSLPCKVYQAKYTEKTEKVIKLENMAII